MRSLKARILGSMVGLGLRGAPIQPFVQSRCVSVRTTAIGELYECVLTDVCRVDCFLVPMSDVCDCM